jgi:hypothetical protein
MKPVIQIWIMESSLATITRDKFPSTWWKRKPDNDDAICITVSLDWYVRMRDYEKELDKNSGLPF